MASGHCHVKSTIITVFPIFTVVLNKLLIYKVHIAHQQANDQKTKVDMINIFVN